MRKLAQQQSIGGLKKVRINKAAEQAAAAAFLFLYSYAIIMKITFERGVFYGK